MKIMTDKEFLRALDIAREGAYRRESQERQYIELCKRIDDLWRQIEDIRAMMGASNKVPTNTTGTPVNDDLVYTTAAR